MAPNPLRPLIKCAEVSFSCSFLLLLNRIFGSLLFKPSRSYLNSFQGFKGKVIKFLKLFFNFFPIFSYPKEVTGKKVLKGPLYF